MIPLASSGRQTGSILGLAAVFVLAALASSPDPAAAQDVRVGDLTIQEQAVPVRLVGYGLVIGLDGTGDRPAGGRTGGHTVQSVANLLRRFEVDVPPEVLRMRNVAAVLVTAEVSPFLRAGGRFDVHVSSIGDARSIRGGVLWMTPLIADVGGAPMATAQGALLISDGGNARGSYTVETTARIPAGGLLEGELARPVFASSSRLLLRQPDLLTATRVATVVNGQFGDGTAIIEDPGSILLSLPDDPMQRAAVLTEVTELRVQPSRIARIVIDGRDGTVVAGGDLVLGNAVVSHGLVTLSIGDGGAPGDEAFGGFSVPAGTTAQQVAAALHAFQTPPGEIAAIFESLREIGALSAEVVIR
jgi:flagellar P-ring protein FlgI